MSLGVGSKMSREDCTNTWIFVSVKKLTIIYTVYVRTFSVVEGNSRTYSMFHRNQRSGKSCGHKSRGISLLEEYEIPLEWHMLPCHCYTDQVKLQHCKFLRDGHHGFTSQSHTLGHSQHQMSKSCLSPRIKDPSSGPYTHACH